MDKITINNLDYIFISDFKDNEKLRKGFNTLSRNTFEFDFENYYQSGYWNERYIPYSIVHDDKLVSNVSVNILDFHVFGNMNRYIQIGTVMTDKNYRYKGLSRHLLETVISEWEDKCDMIYLFANNTVIDFYPKFGFLKKCEYQYEKKVKVDNNEISAKKLNMDCIKNRDMLFYISSNTVCFSSLIATNNTGLVMFYATSFMKEDVYYIESLEAIVFAKYDENTLYLHDIFCMRTISIEDIILAMSNIHISLVVLGFTPINKENFICKKYVEEDNTLFVLKKDKTIFDIKKVMLPILSHA